MKPALYLLILFTASGASGEKFPDDFIFGVSSSAYQIEGAWNVNGKGKNIWEAHIEKNPDFVVDGSDATVACDSYHKYKEDVALLKELGVDFYRFSIAWSRILPTGFAHSVNEDGIRYYNNLIDELIANGIQPMVTLYHWDLPQPLQDLGGWTNAQIADYFEDYARVAFENFGDRVKTWITMNEPCVGYDTLHAAPGIEDFGIAGYLCNYVTLLGHAKAYRLYERDFKSKQNGTVGITVSIRWGDPAENRPEDIEATKRYLEFSANMLLHPIFTGSWSPAVSERIQFRSIKEGYRGSRLPALTREDSRLVKGALDFIGLNHYTTFLISDAEEAPFDRSSSDNDLRVRVHQDASWPHGKSSWLKEVPWGLRRLLNYLKDKYNNFPIIITENGYSDNGELDDQGRVQYITSYLEAVLDAIRLDGVNVKGYTVWSLLDNFEWKFGYTEKFGLFRVDFDDPKRPRTVKKSAKIYKEIIKRREIVYKLPEATTKEEL